MILGLIGLIALGCIGGVMSGLPLWFGVGLFICFLMMVIGMVRSQ